MRSLLPWCLVVLGLAGVLPASAATGAGPSSLGFQPHPDGGFQFDTGTVRGRLRLGGKSLGLQQVIHVPTGRRLDRSNGFLGHYRVFAGGTRYGAGAWDWPSQATLLPNGRVRVDWPAAADRPFQLRATYRIAEAGVVEVVTELEARAELVAPEVFLASYFDGAFDTAKVAVGSASNPSGWHWSPATRDRGEWQMYPRDSGVVPLIQDGRWSLPPNPVAWETLENLGPWAMAARLAEDGALVAGVVAAREDCFAVALPHQTETHYSLYLSLFGRTLPAGAAAVARAFWVVAESETGFASRAQALTAGEGGLQGSVRGSRIMPDASPRGYPDGRPSARYRLEARDAGVVLRHGTGPGGCDRLGARDVWAWEADGRYFLHYDGAGPRGWLACRATSTNMTDWVAQGPVLDFGARGERDSASASYGVTYRDGKDWHLFYLGTPHVTPAPDFVPGFPYLTLKARGPGPEGPWRKQPMVTPFEPRPGTYYSVTASPGHIVARQGEYLMFFSAASDGPVLRTLGLARTRDLDGSWTLGEEPILPPAEQVENSSLHHDEDRDIWFLFTNHVGLRDGLEYTDAIWVYWSRDLRRWDPKDKAVVLDGDTCRWSKRIIGLPSVVRVGNRLAMFYDGHEGEALPPGVKSHMNRDIGLAWIDLPIRLPGAVP